MVMSPIFLYTRSELSTADMKASYGGLYGACGSFGHLLGVLYKSEIYETPLTL
jgi:hypothetical protein